MVMKAISELDIEVAVRPKKGLGRVREIVCLHVDYLGETYQLWLLVDVSFLPKDLLPDQDSVLFSAAKAGELAGQTRRVKIVDERCGGEVRLAGVPDWLEAKLEWAGPCPANALNQKPTRLGYVEFKLLRPPPTEFAQAEVRLERPDDPEATCPLTVIAYGAKE